MWCGAQVAAYFNALHVLMCCSYARVWGTETLTLLLGAQGHHPHRLVGTCILAEVNPLEAGVGHMTHCQRTPGLLLQVLPCFEALRGLAPKTAAEAIANIGAARAHWDAQPKRAPSVMFAFDDVH